MSALRPLASLLFSTSFLLIGHGLHLTLIPLRGVTLGFSDTLIGLSGSAYFLGFVTGCLTIPQIIARVGHIRSFSALLSALLCSLLLIALNDSPWVWMPLRFVFGAMMCGAYTVIESWLNDQTAPEARGKTLATYTFLVLVSIAGGQSLITMAPIESDTLFIVAGLAIAAAIVPVSLTRSLAPAPVPSTKLSFSLLYSRSHTAFAGGMVSGIAMGSFWSLGAVYASRVGSGTEFVSHFILASIAGGALAQYPVGLASDRIDRRYVLAFLCAWTTLSCIGAIFAESDTLILVAMMSFGASGNAIYSISLAKAADNSKREEFVTIGTSVLLLNSLAAAVAPVIFGQVMGLAGEWALFGCIGAASFLGGVYIFLQPKGETAVEVEAQSSFVAAGAETVPASFDSDPRGPEVSEADLSPAEELPAIHEAENDADDRVEDTEARYAEEVSTERL